MEELKHRKLAPHCRDGKCPCHHPIHKVSDVVREFTEKYPDLRQYFPAYWSAPDEKGIQTAIPSKAKDMTLVVEEWLKQNLTTLLSSIVDRIEGERRKGNIGTAGTNFNAALDRAITIIKSSME